MTVAVNTIKLATLFDSHEGAFVLLRCRLGRGVFARRQIRKGEVFVFAYAPVAWDPCWSITLWDALDRQEHGWLESAAIFMNHSCQPNMEWIRDLDLLLKGERDGQPALYMRAVRDIHPEEQLCWDYSTTEPEVTGIDRCLCGYCDGGPVPGYRQQAAGMDARRRLCQPSWTREEIEAIEALSEAKDMPAETVVRQALRAYQLAAKHEPVNLEALRLAPDGPK